MKASWTRSFRGKIRSLIMLPEAPGELSWVSNSLWVFSSTSVHCSIWCVAESVSVLQK